MDNPGLNDAEHHAALRSLDRINDLFGVNRHLWQTIQRTTRRPVQSLLDVGVGGGGFLRHVARQSLLPSRLIALDFSLRALMNGEARARTDPIDYREPMFRWTCADARRLPLSDGSVDVVTCSLFLHHFDEADIERILREFRRVARIGIVIGDLVRSRTSLAMTWLATRLLTRSRVVHVDSALSVRAALVPDELRALADQAGLRGAGIRRRFPFRMVLTWRR